MRPIRNLRVTGDQERAVRSRISRGTNRAAMKLEETSEQRRLPQIFWRHANPQGRSRGVSQFINRGFYKTVPVSRRQIGQNTFQQQYGETQMLTIGSGMCGRERCRHVDNLPEQIVWLVVTVA